MANRVSGRSAIVTGAARGIGRAVAMRLAQEGADVLVNTRDPKTLEAVYEDVKKAAKGGKVAKFLRCLKMPVLVFLCNTIIL